jgi:hypothetical protein
MLIQNKKELRGYLSPLKKYEEAKFAWLYGKPLSRNIFYFNIKIFIIKLYI